MPAASGKAPRQDKAGPERRRDRHGPNKDLQKQVRQPICPELLQREASSTMLCNRLDPGFMVLKGMRQVVVATYHDVRCNVRIQDVAQCPSLSAL